jgi:DNA replication protein DnaC
MELAGDQQGDENSHYVHKRCPACGYTNSQVLAEDYGLPTNGQNCTFELMSKQYDEVNVCADEMVKILSSGKGWLVMTSHSGPGKSYLMLAAINRAIQRQVDARYVLYTQMMTTFQDAQWNRHPEGLQYSAYMRALTGVSLLCLDEFAEGNHSPWRDQTIRELLVCRSDPVWSPTFFATNKTPEEIKARMPWLYSRFFAKECRRFTFRDVPDLRGRI